MQNEMQLALLASALAHACSPSATLAIDGDTFSDSFLFLVLLASATAESAMITMTADAARHDLMPPTMMGA